MKFQILSVFWGEPYCEWFLKGALRSLSFKQNREAILEHCSTWNIFCDENQVETVKEATKLNFSDLKINIRSTSHLRAFIDQHQSAMCMQIADCLKSNERLLFVPPDTVFSDGSINSLMKIGREPKTCVAVAHPRVLPDFLLNLKQAIGKPNELVNLAWKNLHQSWSDAEVGHPRQNSFIGGVKWERLGFDLYSITHHLPTVYFADFTEEDLMYFKTQTSFGCYDHTWPADILIRQHRQRYVGSSEAAFICEITHREKNIPPVKEGNTDSFWREHAHNLQNRQTQVIFRGNW